MKGLTYALKIIVIVLNTIFLAGIIFFLIRLDAHAQSLRDWAGSILIFALPAVTLITIALTFHKKLEILTSVLRIIAILVNASFLVIFIYETASGHPKGFLRWLVYVTGYGLPVVNILAVALTFRKGKAETPAE